MFSSFILIYQYVNTFHFNILFYFNLNLFFFFFLNAPLSWPCLVGWMRGYVTKPSRYVAYRKRWREMWYKTIVCCATLAVDGVTRKLHYPAYTSSDTTLTCILLVVWKLPASHHPLVKASFGRNLSNFTDILWNSSGGWLRNSVRRWREKFQWLVSLITHFSPVINRWLGANTRANRFIPPVIRVLWPCHRFGDPGPVPGWLPGPAVLTAPQTQSDRPGPGHHVLLCRRLPPGERRGGGDSG